MLLTDTKIEFLKGVGPKKAALFNKELGVVTFGDLLEYYPFRYEDKSKFIKVREIQGVEVYVQLKGVIRSKEVIGSGRQTRLSARFYDDSGSIELVFFKGLKWLKDSIYLNRECVVFGKPSFYQGTYNMVHPEIEWVQEGKKEELEQFAPIYRTSEKMKNGFITSKVIERLTRELSIQLRGYIPETLPGYIVSQMKLYTREQALLAIHHPKNIEEIQQARLRLKFEEIFFLQLEYAIQKHLRKQVNKGHVFVRVGTFFHTFYQKYLPFSLTKAQQRVIKEIRNDCGSGYQMNRLLQGDVGSGKTMVALLCMLIALDNGFQACMMAPTEILATQHYNTLCRLLKEMPVKIELLTGSTKTSERKTLLKNVEEGLTHILIGTHALIEDNVVFHRLGFVVIDEQHRFGVKQRAKLWDKNPVLPPHILVMTATPIPRTLAMTIYGELDVSVIDELPPGRKPVKTIHLNDSSRLKLFAFMRDKIAEGRQIYIVYPLIEESENSDLKDLMDGYESIERSFPLPQYQISIVHGKMKATDKDYEMERFKQGITNIMVSTTVIEVGVDVPNASVMVIENAERFGLSQLHQLRGRVGRGAEQSYCILMTSYKLSDDGKQRIAAMCETSDGFKIAETDLHMRGPGVISGTQQSGLPEFKLLQIGKDEQIIRLARNVAESVLAKDPELRSLENALLLQYLNRNRSNIDLSLIS